MAAKTPETTAPPATNDAYTGMLAISLFALIGGCVLLYLDYSQYPDSKGPTPPKAPAIAAPVEAEPKAPAPAPAPKGEQKADAPAPKEGAPKEGAPKAPEDKKGN
jgi:hypothetical protein